MLVFVCCSLFLSRRQMLAIADVTTHNATVLSGLVGWVGDTRRNDWENEWEFEGKKMLRKEREKKIEWKDEYWEREMRLIKEFATTECLKERQASISTKGVFSFWVKETVLRLSVLDDHTLNTQGPCMRSLVSCTLMTSLYDLSASRSGHVFLPPKLVFLFCRWDFLAP